MAVALKQLILQHGKSLSRTSQLGQSCTHNLYLGNVCIDDVYILLVKDTHTHTFFVESSQDVICVEREESSVVEQNGEELSDGLTAHLLVMVVLIDLQSLQSLHYQHYVCTHT